MPRGALLLLCAGFVTTAPAAPSQAMYDAGGVVENIPGLFKGTGD